MRVFVTGGTGLIGSAVVAELLDNGHTVLALADLDTLRVGAAQSDGVIHLAFDHGFSSPDTVAKSVAEEGAALAALGEELVGSGRPLVTVSGTPAVPGRASTEADPLMTEGPVGGRGRTVTSILGLASRGVRSTAVRLPRTVHNQGSGGFAGLLTDIARRTGVSGYPGDGVQRWPAVHALDAAVLFRLAQPWSARAAPWGRPWRASRRCAPTSRCWMCDCRTATGSRRAGNCARGWPRGPV